MVLSEKILDWLKVGIERFRQIYALFSIFVLFDNDSHSLKNDSHSRLIY
jgi:hypothetical protein